jgi:hypothetical protein
MDCASGQTDNTAVDVAVRNTWEIEPARVRFDNPTWTKFESSLVDQVFKVLGLKYLILSAYSSEFQAMARLFQAFYVLGLCPPSY